MTDETGKSSGANHGSSSHDLVMEGKLGKEAAEICNLYSQSVSEYVRRFNEGGMDLLLERKTAPGRKYFLTDDQQKALKKTVLTSSPAEQGLGSVLDHKTLNFIKI